jgi:hypothetical protein
LLLTDSPVCDRLGRVLDIDVTTALSFASYREGAEPGFNRGYKGKPCFQFSASFIGTLFVDGKLFGGLTNPKGFLTAYHLTKKLHFLNAVQQIWAFIQHRCVDKKHGEWFWYAPENGVVDNRPGKVDAWKGPYHNVRACIELLERLREVN